MLTAILNPAHLLRGLSPGPDPEVGVGLVLKELEKETEAENLVLWANLQTPQPKILSLHRGNKNRVSKDIKVIILIYPQILGTVPQDA